MTDRSSPSGPSDQQCQHCGQWFSIRGIDSHERNCSLKDYDAVLVALEDDPGPDVDADPSPDVDADHGADPTPAPVTDGGELQEPPTPEIEDDAGEPSSDDGSDGCPSCGSEDWFAVDALPDHFLQSQPSLRRYDRCCADCSLTGDGDLAPTLEVYAA